MLLKYHDPSYAQRVSLQLRLADFAFDTEIQVQQKNLMDVARTSVEQGTSSLDLLRAARFSVLSSSTSYLFPDDALEGGFQGRAYGFPAFGYSGPQPWIQDLISLLANNLPVIVLQQWALNDTEGHYRLVVGYDQDAQKMVLLDPWDRDSAPRVLKVSMEHFIQLWNKTDENSIPAIAGGDSERRRAFFGMAIVPFDLEVHGINATTPQGSIYTKNITVSAFYRCPAPFNCTDKSLPLDKVQIRLDWVGLTPCDTSGACWMDGTQFQQRRVSLDPILPNDDLGAPQSWLLQCDQTRSGIACARVFEQSSIRVTVYGLLTATLPPVYCCGSNVPFPPSHYMDAIGESVTISLR